VYYRPIATLPTACSARAATQPLTPLSLPFVFQANGDGSLTYDEFVAWWENGLSIDALSDPGGISPATAPATTDAADLSSIPVLDEDRLLRTLERRFRGRCVYTANGPTMLVAVNPYEPLPIYGDDAIDRYADGARLRTLPPHVYGMASAAFTELQLQRRSQVVLISGESGAGKTETAKAVLRMVSALSAMAGGATEAMAGGGEGQSIEQRLLRSSGLLEAFGNCRTVRNSNSSRFGKLVLLYPGPQGAISRVGIEVSACKQGLREGLG
jgi:myosin heavy subunit